MDTIETIRNEWIGQAERPSARPTHVRRFMRVVRSLSMWIARLLERRRSRLALLEMTDEQLKDIGVSRCAAHREGLRPFWD
ncbi:DUF1127 domain-containing protein [Mesorhizobium waimense]|uniref:DUF1127 domain-containing protein n=1 Tax=Mesorhizobium waimense TaxID=1300307 RepID=A0A3A5KND3_9HYPH|nr:DUF1127 domain-containing protein [Mesorhizobium waimense]RJT37489.1 DUF1127 domain-containing protein [Mesorhizobium waimense]